MGKVKMEISNEQLIQFEKDGYMILQNVLTFSENEAIVKEVKESHQKEIWSKALIGKGLRASIDQEQRGDYIFWIEKNDTSAAFLPYWQLVELIQQTLNRNFYLGLNFFESHLACYPNGSFYKRHSDRHKEGSTRRVSFVYYLNPSWKKEYGGLLNVFKNNETKATVMPLLGHCIVFLSEIEHEVTLSSSDRYSITGWFHQKELF